jgi:hypothetical protein
MFEIQFWTVSCIDLACNTSFTFIHTVSTVNGAHWQEPISQICSFSWAVWGCPYPRHTGNYPLCCHPLRIMQITGVFIIIQCTVKQSHCSLSPKSVAAIMDKHNSEAYVTWSSLLYLSKFINRTSQSVSYYALQSI